MEEIDPNGYFVPLEQPCDKILRTMRFERGNISHFWLTYEDADIISRQCFGNVKVRKWYRHTPNVGTHVYLRDGQVLKRAMVSAHIDDGLGIQLTDLDRGDISSHHFFENVFYMENDGTRVRALFVSCVFTGCESFDARCVAEWDTVFEKSMQGRSAIVRFDESTVLEGNLFPTYKVTLWILYNGIKVNINEFLRTATPGGFNLAKIFGRAAFQTLTALYNGQGNGGALEAIRVDSASTQNRQNSSVTRDVANVSNIAGNEGIRVCGLGSLASESDSRRAAHSTELGHTSVDDSSKDNESQLSGNNGTVQRESTELEGVPHPGHSGENANQIGDERAVSGPDNIVESGNPEPENGSEPGSHEDHAYLAATKDKFGADNALTVYCPDNLSSAICQLFVQNGECFLLEKGVCRKVHVKLDPKFYARISEDVVTYRTNVAAPVINSEIRVIITLASDPLNFYVREVDDVSRLDESNAYSCFDIFQNHINKREVYSKLKRFGAYPKVGEAVLLEYKSYWYRAVMREIATVKVGVFFFVDYGWKKEVPFQNTRRITEELANFESRLLNCALDNLVEEGIGKPTDCKLLTDLLDKICVARVMDVRDADDGPMISIKLETSDGQDISEQLAKNGEGWKLKCHE